MHLSRYIASYTFVGRQTSEKSPKIRWIHTQLIHQLDCYLRQPSSHPASQPPSVLNSTACTYTGMLSCPILKQTDALSYNFQLERNAVFNRLHSTRRSLYCWLSTSESIPPKTLEQDHPWPFPFPSFAPSSIRSVLELSWRYWPKRTGGGGVQLLKCLKFCPGIEVYGRFSLKNERL